MTNEEFNNLVQRLQPNTEAVHVVDITDEEMAGLTREQADELVARYGSSALITLPKKERQFFEWLREHDEPIWNDLWGGDETPYQVSLGYLADLLPNRRGFAICDLVDHQNFYFSTDNIGRENGSAFLDAALALVRREERISMEQAFVVEVWRAPIDQWRFAYMYKLPLDQVKLMVQWLLSEEILTLRSQSEEDAPEQEEGLEQA